MVASLRIYGEQLLARQALQCWEAGTLRCCDVGTATGVAERTLTHRSAGRCATVGVTSQVTLLKVYQALPAWSEVVTCARVLGSCCTYTLQFSPDQSLFIRDLDNHTHGTRELRSVPHSQ